MTATTEDGAAPMSLFHVKGSSVQVVRQRHLNSGDCCVLLTPKAVLCWYGCATSNFERASTRAVVELLKEQGAVGAARSVKEFDEGQADDDFRQAHATWLALLQERKAREAAEAQVADLQQRIAELELKHKDKQVPSQPASW